MRKMKLRDTAEDFHAYLDAEVSLLLAEVAPNCPTTSPEFNDVAIAWIQKNAARFRKKWELYRDGRGDCIIGN